MHPGRPSVGGTFPTGVQSDASKGLRSCGGGAASIGVSSDVVGISLAHQSRQADQANQAKPTIIVVVTPVVGLSSSAFRQLEPFVPKRPNGATANSAAAAEESNFLSIRFFIT